MTTPTPSKDTAPSFAPPPQSLPASSAHGATFLISLQIGSRALTFLVNQVLLRHLSPELLGISAQLELYSTTVLFLARESLRVASLRYAGEDRMKDDEGKGKSGEIREKEMGKRLQDIVNACYIAVCLGVLLPGGFSRTYLNTASESVLRVPYFRTALLMYAIAVLVELLSELYCITNQAELTAELTAEPKLP